MDRARGGRETSTAQIAADLAKRGHQVSIICQRASWTHDRLDVRQLGRRGISRVRRLRNFITDVQRDIENQQYDIIHSTLALPGANVYQLHGGTIRAQVASRLRRYSPLKKLTTLLVELLFKPTRRAMRKLEAQVVKNPDVLCLPVSQLGAKELEHDYQRRDGVRVIYIGVGVPQISDHERSQWRQIIREQLGIAPEDFVLLSAANNFALKGVSQAIRAFAQWRHRRAAGPQAHLIILGNDNPGAYRRQAERQGLRQQVIFPGPTDEIFKWYAAADACILLTWYDPCSRVVLEATSWGIPSITTSYNGAAELLADGGIVVDSPTDTQAVADAIDSLADSVRRSEFAKHCLRIADKLSVAYHVDQLLDAYAHILPG